MAKIQNKSPLRIIPLGGLGEVGKNMTAIEYGNDIVVIDCGLAFPDEEMPGVDLVIPDVSYLAKNEEKIRAILLTHGHEDHIGAVPYILQTISAPVYGTRLTIGILENKLQETRLPFEPELYTVEAGDTVPLGVFRAEFIHVNHSIADACCISLKTPLGIVFHTGDFKLDVSPIDGKMMDLTRIGEIGNAGVLLMLGESTNAERAGFTPSERTVGLSLDRIFMSNRDKRIVIATFSSNVHRVQQIINASAKYGRKVAIVGRSMVNVIGAAVSLDYMDVPDGVLIDINDVRRYKPDQLTIITTGSQGEPMSALYRMAFSEHNQIKLSTSDIVVLSASAIPGNEKLVGKIVNALVRSGITVVNDSVADVHVSGHACREELKLMLGLVRPKYFMPIHGEARHLYAHKEIAEFMGIAPSRIFVSEIGKVLEIDRKGARFAGTVPSGKVLVDGSGVGDVGSVVLRDRKLLAQDGLIVVVTTVDPDGREIISGPDIISRGFVYVRDNEEMMNEARRIATECINRCMEKRSIDWMQIKGAVRDQLSRYFYGITKRKPMILPVIMNI
jgi:ribonuclease J